MTELEKILICIEKIMKKNNTQFISNEQLAKEKDNLVDYKETEIAIKKISNLLLKNKINTENLNKELHQLHLKTSDLAWHIDQIRDLIEKIIVLS